MARQVLLDNSGVRGQRRGQAGGDCPVGKRGLGGKLLREVTVQEDELAAGADPLPFLEAMAAMAGKDGLMPEQVWDGAPIPERNLYPGKPSGSAMPLVWAHAEFVKLLVSRSLGRPFDAPRVVRERYHGRCPGAGRVFWSLRLPANEVKAGQTLGIVLPAPATVHWGVDGWRTVTDTVTRDTGLGVHTADLAVASLNAGQRVDFTFRWSDSGLWEGQDFRMDII